MNVCGQTLPDTILSNNDRNAVFQELKSWAKETLDGPVVPVENAIPSNCTAIDSLIGGGFNPGYITEIVEPRTRSGVDSLIHNSIIQARKQLNYIALIDSGNRFDPQSSDPRYLESLLWVRPPKISDIVKVCDILIRDGNFPLLLLDLRIEQANRRNIIRPTEWYRLQRVCKQSQITFVAFTQSSTIPCAQFRLQLTSSYPIEILDLPSQSNQFKGLDFIHCEALKRRHTDDHDHNHDSAEGSPKLRIANAGF